MRARLLGAASTLCAALVACGGGSGSPADPFRTLALIAEPGSGPPPLSVSFRVQGVPQGAVGATYELDAEGDGTFELTGSTPQSIEGAHVFGTRGTFTARLRVTAQGSGEPREAIATISVTEGGIALVNRAQLSQLEAPAIAPDGSELYLAGRGESFFLVDAVSLALNGVVQLDPESRAHRILVTPDGLKAYVWGSIRASLPDYGTAVVDLQARRQVRRLGGGYQFADLTPDGLTLFMPADTALFPDRQPQYHGYFLEARTVATDELAGGIEFPGPVRWVDFATGVGFGAALLLRLPFEQHPRVSLFDPAALQVTGTLTVPGAGSALWATLRPGTGEVYVLADAAAAGIRADDPRVDPSTLRPRLVILDAAGGLIGEIDLPVPPAADFGALSPYEWSADGRYLYVPGDGGLLVVDATTRTIAAHVPPEVAHGCDIALDPIRPRAYITDYDGIVSALELSAFPPR